MLSTNKNILTNFHNNKDLFYWIFLGSFLILSFWLRWEALEVVRLNQWLARDIDRALNLFQGNYFPLAGPETTNGLRLPGPFLYILMAIPLWFHFSYESIFNFYFLLNFSSLILSFYVVRKYFDFNIAFLTTALQSTHLLYIEAVSFPINPTFLLPLIPFLLWSILEFTLNRNEKAVPLIVLVVSLGVQIHLSIATFLLVPFISGLIFKIKVSIRTILKTILVGLITFSPFLFYLNNSYKPPISITHVTKFDPFSSFLEPFKILTVQNTIKRLSNFNIGQGNLTNFLEVSDLYTLVQLTILNFSLLGFALFIILKIKKESIQNYKKETIVFLFFYCPALIYDLIRPWEKHFWYNYIFILPTALMVSIGLTKLIGLSKTTRFKLFSKLTVLFLITYLCVNNFLNFHRSKELVQNSSQIGNYQNFHALKKLVINWSNKTNIPLGIIFNRTYIEGIQIPSKHLFENSLTSKNFRVSLKDFKINKCVYIIDRNYIIKNQQKLYPEENKRLGLFLMDPTIKINLTGNFLIEDRGINNRTQFRYFRFYEYETKFNQPCYQNLSNTFTSTLKDKKLLADYYSFQKNGDNLLEKNIKVTPSNLLKTLRLKYVFINQKIKYPIRFQINLKKVLNDYDLNFMVDSYSWGINKTEQIVFKELSFFLDEERKNDKRSNLNKFEIISRNSFVAYGLGVNLEKFNWFRNYKFEKRIDLSTSNFVIKVFGKFVLLDDENQEEIDLKINIPLKSI